MPDEVDLDDLFERIHLIARLDAAEKDYEDGRFVSDEEIERDMLSWFE